MVPALSCLSVAVVAELWEGPWAGPLIRRVPDMAVASLVLAAGGPAATSEPPAPQH